MFKQNTYRTVLLAFAGMLWIGIVFAGMYSLWAYENQPGNPGTPPRHWPPASRLQPSRDRFNLVMLAHPDCPCSRASIAELDVLMAQLPGKLNVFVLFTKPGASAAEMQASSLWKNAEAIPGVTVSFDSLQAEMSFFNGYISGQTFLYNPNGDLVFHGGITGARGHQGNNSGLEAVILQVNGDPEAPQWAPVFGCSLRNPGAGTLLQEPTWTK